MGGELREYFFWVERNDTDYMLMRDDVKGEIGNTRGSRENCWVVSLRR